MLLGLLREGEGVAARVLENLGAEPSNFRIQASTISFFLTVKTISGCLQLTEDAFGNIGY